MRILTTGFTKRTAENFFETLKKAGVKRLIDVRISNSSQLAGFSKRDDLRYFCRAILDIDYDHRPDLGPSEALFDNYKKRGLPWKDYEKAFIALLKERRIETLDRAMFEDACLLCTEDWPDKCHRRLVAEYLESHWDGVEVEHLV